MDFSSTLSNEILPFVTPWTDIKGNITKQNKSERHKYHRISYVESKNKKAHRSKNRSQVARGRRLGMEEMGEGPKYKLPIIKSVLEM